MSRSRRVRPELHQLDVFLEVVAAGSFAAAARRIGCTQPAVSQVIARLEDIYGGDLFERRRGARLELTPIGEAVLPSARILLHTLDQHMTRAVAAAQSRLGALRVGIGSGLGHLLLAAGIAAFAKRQPGVRLHFVEHDTESLLRMLVGRSVDLVVVPAFATYDDPSLMKEILWDQPLGVVLRDDHPLAGKNMVSWPDLASIDLLVWEEDSVARCVRERFGHAGKWACHDVSEVVLHQMVAAGLGEAALAHTSIKPNATGLVVRPIGTTVPIEAVWRVKDGNPIRHRLLSTLRHAAVSAKAEAALADVHWCRFQ